MIDMEEERFTQLTELTANLFGDGACPACAQEFELVETELLEVKGFGGPVTLMYTFDHDKYYEVAFPPELLRLLRKDDMFLMTIARNKDEEIWTPLYVGPPYESVEVDYSATELDA